MNANRQVRVHYDISNGLKYIPAFEFFIYGIKGINQMIVSGLGTAMKKSLHDVVAQES